MHRPAGVPGARRNHPVSVITIAGYVTQITDLSLTGAHARLMRTN